MSNAVAMKRPACDRCKSQKLRCNPPAGITFEASALQQPCSRCERAGAVCITSNTRSAGRPRRKRPADPAFHLHNQPVPIFDQASARNPAVPASITASMLSETSLWPQPTSALAKFDIFSSALMTPSESTDDSFLELLSTLQQGEVQAMPSTNVQSQFEVRPVTDEADATGRPGHDQTVEPVKIIDSSFVDLLNRLIRLNDDLVQQIEYAKQFNAPWTPSQPQKSCSHSTSGGPREDGIRAALRASSELIDTLQTISGMTKSLDAGTEHSTLPLALQTICCHILLLQRFDHIFRVAYQRLRDNPTSAMESCRNDSTSQVQIPGMYVSDGLLQARLFLQAIEHCLVTIEGLVGTPQEFRLAKNPSSSRDSIWAVDSCSFADLTRSAMTQATTCHGSGEELMPSLRNGLANLKAHLLTKG